MLPSMSGFSVGVGVSVGVIVGVEVRVMVGVWVGLSVEVGVWVWVAFLNASISSVEGFLPRQPDVIETSAIISTKANRYFLSARFLRPLKDKQLRFGNIVPPLQTGHFNGLILP